MTFFRLELGVSTDFFNVTPSVSGRFNAPVRQVYVGTGGDINVRPESNANYVILRNFGSGGVIQGSITAISNVGTTASNIVAFI